MAAARIIRVRRLDDPNESNILLHLSSSGPSTLDLLLKATDGIHPYSTNIEENRVAELKAKKSNLTREQWTAALKLTLLGQDEPMSRPFDNLELVASLNSKNELCLSIRQVTSGISQRFGAITLQRKVEMKIELFDWAGIAAVHAANSDSKVLQLEKRIVELSATTTSLTNQIQEFTALREYQENINFEKFKRILNNKKLKIRDQQRLLATAKVDLMNSNITSLSESLRTGSKSELLHEQAPSSPVEYLYPTTAETKITKRRQAVIAQNGDAHSNEVESDTDITVEAEDEKLDPLTKDGITANAEMTSHDPNVRKNEPPQCLTDCFRNHTTKEAQSAANHDQLEEETDDEL